MPSGCYSQMSLFDSGFICFKSVFYGIFIQSVFSTSVFVIDIDIIMKKNICMQGYIGFNI